MLELSLLLMAEHIFLEVAFDGGALSALRSDTGKPTIRSMVSQAVSVILRRKCFVYPCCSMEKASHAAQFFFHLKDEGDLRDDLPYKLNALLPRCIKAVAIFTGLPPGAHARRDVSSFRYRYYIHFEGDPFRDPYSLYIPLAHSGRLMIRELAADLPLLVGGGKDSNGSCSGSFFSWVREAGVQFNADDSGFFLEVTADFPAGRLTRKLAGLLLRTGQGKLTKTAFIRILEEQDPLPSGIGLPARGLHLWQVSYPYLIKDPEESATLLGLFSTKSQG